MTTLNTSTLRPGLLVSLKTSLRGNVSYRKAIIEAEHATDEGAKERWETERTIADPAEYNAAKIARNAAGYVVRKICSTTAFGLLCPERDADVLADAITEARRIADEFNSTAKLCRLSVYVITGRVAADDVEAVKAINNEIRDLLEDITQGIEKADVKSIRDSAKAALEIGKMLSPDAEARVKLAVDTARAVATKINASAEAAAVEIDRVAIRRITEQRTAFLDLDEQGAIAAPIAGNRALDFEPIPPIKAASVARPALELE